jgi:hypothetical protein
MSSAPFGDYHSYNILVMVEDIERAFLQQLSEVYLEKPNVIMRNLRNPDPRGRKVF